MTARIGLKDVRIHAPHGFYAEEHRMGNEFSIDVTVEARIGNAAQDDDLGQTVNYGTIYYLLKAEMKRPTELLEALAYRIAARIVDQFANVVSVDVKLRKLNPPLGGKVGAAFVEISMTASQSSGYDSAGDYHGARTFEDHSTRPLHYDIDGPFSGPGGPGTMRGAPARPRPILPVELPPPATMGQETLPWESTEGEFGEPGALFGEGFGEDDQFESLSGFTDEDDWELGTDPEPHAVSDDANISPFPDGLQEDVLGEDWDLPQGFEIDFDALGIPRLDDKD